VVRKRAVCDTQWYAGDIARYSVADKPKRLEAAALIQEFFEGRLTNFGFADRFPRSSDKALLAIHSVLWFVYDELREHRLEGKHKLTEEGRDIFQRCILFLSTELEYTGIENFVDLAAPFKRLWYWISRKPKPKTFRAAALFPPQIHPLA
jgi:hypothetical protein